MKQGKAKAPARNFGAPEGPRSATPAGAPLGQDRRAWTGKAADSDSLSRVDRYVAEVARVLSRSQIKARDALFFVNGREVKPSRPLKPGDLVEVRWLEEPSSDIQPEELELSVIYEDERCLVIDKAQGMVTHPGHGNRRGTLANALLWRLLHSDGGSTETGETAGAGPGFRAGIVHRLDKDTSGLIIAAKDVKAQEFLSAQFRDRKARKEYLAVTRGIPTAPEGRISDRLGRDPRDRKRFASVSSGGKAAVTDYRVLVYWGPRPDGGSRPASARPGAAPAGPGYALLSLKPRTGRTHQLRVHMAGLGCPILGDPIYGKRDALFPAMGLLLHAYRLRIALPGPPEEMRSFRAATPERFKEAIQALERRFGPGIRAFGRRG